ncbi:undecaprenyl/decaprenyl-phosphate alpha-N-acetylglucosaminyl 1-phosphate transferase [Paenibacillus sp. MWE-103]|uniref:Undecaprenyl/decaprenyl-phosphate alpha-N-acetylglucosaminyl 1-phosphate transferase n=1 Tax=Paenibacillus artemisiicola TaxID=1172618 RepID=A0ABS3WI90_9BACL|nr:MraY family glycosyltransferase [Paenibacillus artemisiicola]MBO7748028.1 undecaprenyl/decaprenyl-phosphate alpha-N-acetylglucosaminyl 1-phosphate transferase [Paenibacillus artemisiicola]
MSHVVLYTAAFIISLCLALALTPLVIKLAFKVGAIDKPNHRKVHTKIMPRMGGLGIYAAFIGAYFAIQPFIPEGLFRSYDRNLINALLAGGSIIVLLGALDDRFELSAKVKLLGQIIAACVVVFGFGVKIDLLNIPFGEAMQPVASWISIPLTIIWIVGVTNAINLIDGLDGLAAGVSGIAIGTILVMAAVMGFAPVILLSALLLGGVIGFLVYNFHPAKIFMGDTGSLFLGFGLATLSMLGFKQVTMVSFVTPLLIIGVPLSDTFFAIVRRWVNKKPIFAPDKGHLHHCLRELGFSHRRTVLIIYAIAAFFGLCAVLQSTIVQSDAANWITFGVILVLVFFLQIGAELIGIVDKSRRPLINFLQRRLIRTEQSRSK